MKSTLTDHLSKFSSAKALVVGDLLLDEYLISDVSRISPEAPVPVAHVIDEKFVLGGAANVANNLRALGVKTELIGVLGNDRPGQRFLALIKQNRIGSKGILMDSGMPTIQKIRIVSHHQQLLRVDRENLRPFSVQFVKRLKSAVDRLVPMVDVVVLSDYAKGVLSGPIVRHVIALARKHHLPVVADAKPAHKSFYKGVTVILPNHKEAQEFANMIEKNDASLTRIGRKIQKQLMCNVIITRGPKGMRVFDGPTVVDIMTKARQIYDVTGAGDTVTAVVAGGLATGLDLSSAAHLASFAAGVVVEKFGTATVTPAELRKALLSHE